jgi:hypothetical protein
MLVTASSSRRRRGLCVSCLAVLLMACSSASAAAEHTLSLTVRDQATGKPLPCRVSLVDANGRSVPFTTASAEAAVSYDVTNRINPQSVEQHTTLAEFPARAPVEPGAYLLRVSRGQSWLPARESITVTNTDVEVTVELKQFVDPTSAGWYSGDTHLHRTVDELKTVILAEDLNVALPLTYWVTTSDTPPSAGNKNQASIPPAELIEVDATHVIWPRSTEYEIFSVGDRRHTLGALFVLGHREPLESTVPPWKPLIESVQQREPQAAFDTDKLDWPFAMLLPAIAPGALVELANNHLWETEFAFRDWNSEAPPFLRPPHGGTSGGERAWLDYTLGMYYTLLDCGLRLPPSAGTASGVHPVPAGFGRVFVHCPEGFTYDAWLAGLKGGRSVVSTGPFLEAAVDGQMPGHVFHVSRDQRADEIVGRDQQHLAELPVTISITSPTPVLFAEVIVNGRPDSLLRPTNEPLPGGGYRSTLTHTARIDRSSWIAVRCFEDRDHGRIRFAHTAPWYVEVDDEPLRIERERKGYLIDRMQHEIERSRGVVSAEALEEYQRALAFYEAIPEIDDREEVARAARPLGDGPDREAWLENMLVHHRLTIEELRRATGLSLDKAASLWRTHNLPNAASASPRPAAAPQPIRVLPYPGGRHPRRGFLEGAIDPQRETKVSIFPPWAEGGYVVVDVPEAIFSNLGLTYLAHTHIPTIWDEQGISLEPLEWQQTDTSLSCERRLPNGIRVTSTVARTPAEDGSIAMQIRLTNGTPAHLSGLRVQVCTMLAATEGFQHQQRLEKREAAPFIAVKSVDHDRWIVTGWEPLHRIWTNPPVPCIHADPIFPDCPPGETVEVRGRLWFYEGTDIDGFIASCRLPR